MTKIKDAVDLDLNFSRHPVTGDVSKKTGIEALKRSVRNLILLNDGDKPFHPEISTDTKDQLFENFTIFTSSDLEERIKKTVERYEPRVFVKEVKAESYFDKNEINILVKIGFVNNTTGPIETIPVTIKRLR
tara:strand:+ start:29 stop:424 length:396 start_codon:yes stop_codon:yes gene_type:complete